MADQQRNDLNPPAGPPEPDGRTDENAPADSPPVEGGGWHEPPPPEGSSRPVVVEQWFVPNQAAPLRAEVTPATPDRPDDDTTSGGDGDAPPQSSPPEIGPAPAMTGGWYKPLDADLAALLSGAAGTIVEPPQPDGGAEPDNQQATRILEASDGDGAIAEPEAPADSTPVPQATPAKPMPGLTEAEAAYAARQRSREEQAIQPPDGEPTAEDLSREPGEAGAAEPEPEPAEAPTQPDPFEQVERKVSALRARYEAGSLTREELQNELR